MIPELKDALHLDYETRGIVPLPQCGPWVYAEHKLTSVWVACFARGDGPVEAWHPGDPVPRTIVRAAEDDIPWVAHNVGFERAITAVITGPKYGWPVLPIERWWCTASMAAAMSLPRSLEQGALLMGCVEQKDMEGHLLMKRMMKPWKTIKCPHCRDAGCVICDYNGSIYFWRETPEEIARGTIYCAQDVRTERAFCTQLRSLSPFERRVWLLDQKMNERGVRVDIPLVHKALAIAKASTAALNDKAQKLTGAGWELSDGTVTKGALTTQVAKLKMWCNTEGANINDLRKETIEGMLKSPQLDALLKQALELRAEAAKTSTAKLNAYLTRTCVDGRMRDNLMYHGATHTGRWAGRGAQLQNLPSRYIVKSWQIERALECIAAGWSAADLVRFFDRSVLEVISACLRGMIIADPGHEIMGADYNAIEARGTAWLAGAKALLGVFARGEDPYLYQAVSLYRNKPGQEVDISWVDWNDLKSVEKAKLVYKYQRALGKIAVLGLGYQMGWQRFQAMCAKERILITDDDAREAVWAYRHENPEIPALWGDMGDCAFEAVRKPGVAITVAASEGKIKFLKQGTWLYMQLPSGRLMHYASPKIEKMSMPWIDQETGDKALGWGVTYMSVNSLTHKWSRHHGYGGKWTENAVQGLSRDVLAGAMLRLEDAGYPQIVSVHDEPVSEPPIGFGSIGEYVKLMCVQENWMAGLPLIAEGWRGPRFRK